MDKVRVYSKNSNICDACTVLVQINMHNFEQTRSNRQIGIKEFQLTWAVWGFQNKMR